MNLCNQCKYMKARPTIGTQYYICSKFGMAVAKGECEKFKERTNSKENTMDYLKDAFGITK